MKATKLLKWAIYLSSKNFSFASYLIILILRYLFSFENNVNKNTKIGNGVQFKYTTLSCAIHPRITIDGNIKYKNGKLGNTGAPTIGNNPVLYSGAVMVGPITIGGNCVIGTNTVVLRDIPPSSIVYGRPAIVKEASEGMEYILRKIIEEIKNRRLYG